jgi:hypothetical protein
MNGQSNRNGLQDPETRLAALEARYAKVSTQLQAARLERHLLGSSSGPERGASEAKIIHLIERCGQIRAEIDRLEDMA